VSVPRKVASAASPSWHWALWRYLKLAWFSTVADNVRSRLRKNGRVSRTKEDRAVLVASASSFRFECVKRAGRVHQGCACVDTDADAQGFGNLFLGGAELACRCGVNGDTAIAAQCDRDRKRDQFAGLGIKVSSLGAGATERRIALDGIRREFAYLTDAGENLVSVVVPIAWPF
jgi:hypothetical protein